MAKFSGRDTYASIIPFDILNLVSLSQEDILSIWNRTANDLAVTNRIRDTFRRVLNLPQGTVTEYKAHNDSIKDHSSFRNTDVFVR